MATVQIGKANCMSLSFSELIVFSGSEVAAICNHGSSSKKYLQMVAAVVPMAVAAMVEAAVMAEAAATAVDVSGFSPDLINYFHAD